MAACAIFCVILICHPKADFHMCTLKEGFQSNGQEGPWSSTRLGSHNLANQARQTRRSPREGRACPVSGELGQRGSQHLRWNNSVGRGRIPRESLRAEYATRQGWWRFQLVMVMFVGNILIPHILLNLYLIVSRNFLWLSNFGSVGATDSENFQSIF